MTRVTFLSFYLLLHSSKKGLSHQAYINCSIMCVRVSIEVCGFLHTLVASFYSAVMNTH